MSDRSPIHLNHDPKLVTKPWGEEWWYCLCPDYFCTKTIRINRGTRTSYQYHVQKEEINFIRAGEAEVWLEDAAGVVQKHVLYTGDSFFVPATRKHRVIALTDLEMFEVSNPFVDDVVRIQDEFGRGDGKIEDEHKTPAVLILAAGLGSRLKNLTAHKNKALIPVANRAVISHIIERFPVEYDLVVAVGYAKDSLIDYCRLAHPDRKFQFVEVDGWDNSATDPGHSALTCAPHLQRPFYFVAVDCLLEKDPPHLDGDWIGVYPTDYPEKYATVALDDGRVVTVVNKRADGFDHAFIGLAAVRDYRTFWTQLAASPTHELVAAWKDVTRYSALRAKTIRWWDAGNLDDLSAAREHFRDTPLSSPKSLDEVTYHVENRVIKFHPDVNVTQNRLARGLALNSTDIGPLAPAGLQARGNLLAYDWVCGQNLYQLDSPALYSRFLDSFWRTIERSHHWTDPDLVRRFHWDKTAARTAQFRAQYGESYFAEERTINGTQYASLDTMLAHASQVPLDAHHLYTAFHGDLHWDNVVYDLTQDRFTYVDWRESFAGETRGGDLYYDLGKLYAGCVVPFELLKDDGAVSLTEGSSVVSYSYPITPALREATHAYEHWLVDHGYSLNRVRFIAGLALINIAPLHTDVWNRVLLYKGTELLQRAVEEIYC